MALTPLVASPSTPAQVENPFYFEPAHDEQHEHRDYDMVDPVRSIEPFVPDAEIVPDHVLSPSSLSTVPMDAFYPEPDTHISDEQARSVPDSYQAAADHSFHMLNNAARMIAEVEGEASPGARLPRPSRLSPLRDISADIRRESTPLPATAYSTEHMQNAFHERIAEDLDRRLPDLWPWLHTAEIDEGKDEWIDHDDPLLSRRFPEVSGKTRIISSDIREAFIYQTRSFLQNMRRAPRKWLRLAFIIMCAIAIIALGIDAALVAFLEHGATAFSSLPPTMTLSTHFANQGDLVTIHLKDFAPNSSIVLSHDIQERVKLINEGDIVHADAQGSKDVVMRIDSSWEAGSHTIEAEDIKVRYTASAVLSIGVGPTRPAHLQLESTNIDLGSALQGANTLYTIRLDNAGGGSINWSASSGTSWLMFTPDHGMFSDHQDVQVAVDRTKLNPGSYDGKITFSSNVSDPQDIMVHMEVTAIPANAGAVLDVSPAVMSFTAVDGMADPATQALVISNPGRKPLHWSVHNQPSNTKADTNSYVSNLVGFTNPWLTTSATAGTIPPGGNVSINVNANSRTLLPGTYSAQLQFQDPQALNSPQSVAVSLTVQPRCSLLLSTGNLLFTTVAGQSSTTNSQVLNLVGNASCGGSSNWSVSSSVHWLTITPSQGNLMNAATASTTITANTSGMSAGTYNGVLTISMAQSTQTVSVQLIIQPPPLPSAPVMGASPLNLNFSVTSGQDNPPAQSIAVANTGRSPLTLAVAPTPLAKWLSVMQGPGIISAGQTGSLMVNVDATGLTPGSYSGQIALSGVDANGNPSSGSPQTIMVTFTVFEPCSLTFPSATSLAFNAFQGGVDPPSQQVTFTVSGNCSWPLKWRINNGASASWLKLVTATGQFTTSGQSATVVVDPSDAGLLAGNYNTSANIVVTDSTGTRVPGSPQKLSVAMSVQQPCTFQSSSPGLTFSALQSQTASQQSIPLSLSGSCVLPVSWTAASDSSWLVLSSTTGSDNGQGSLLGVSVDATGLNVGTYNGVITVTPSGSGGASVDGKPQIPVTLTVTGATVSVTVNSCASAGCLSPMPLAGALVSLSNLSGNVIASQTTDVNGVATFNNVPAGTYTAVANGTDVAQVVYSGSSPVSVVGNVVTMQINVIANFPTPSP
ncbi:hypothetical protein KDH_43470 [Dictyobacter sp. S3.2.2.5]|uniref:BACON domain-containing protein n=2 Tax=Dictyobacter halimunensis TaxID=3026934 RepID=A0ABQ6FV93_9CHLR|nr:hypothetical protein KDH_43470 [Dictyobacter sp. S3.2.2.5]